MKKKFVENKMRKGKPKEARCERKVGRLWGGNKERWKVSSEEKKKHLRFRRD